MENGRDAQGIPVFPPDWFVVNFNREPMAAGQPFRGPLDPLVMMAWHMASGWGKPPPPFVSILAGI